ncbi:helix-turn-helix domain-containing protein [Streptacidiphilus pinicola]|nr:helix-turn-helix domain-containing protein [Streptacidiphilus pinicola]
MQRQPSRAIAARWGFTNAAAFSRTFRTAFDVSPNAYRAAVLGAADPQGA